METLSLAFESAPFGICALSLDQKILLLNRTAERILGLSPDEVLGRRCNDLKRGTGPGSLTPECQEGCPSIRYLRSGLIPPPTRLRMLCASGGYKWVSAVPMVVVGALNGSPILIHLFEDAARRRVSAAEPKAFRDILWRWIEPTCPTAILNRISPPMMFPICLAGRGKSCIWWRRDGKTQRIAVRLGISLHTVRTHIRNPRHKFRANSKLDAVAKGLRLGLVSVERSS